MANILDYLDWFGNVSLDQVPFNQVDALILAQFSYIHFEGVLDQEGSKSLTMKQLSDAYFSYHTKEEIYDVKGLVSPLTPFLLQKMGQGTRWKDAQVSHYQSILDPATHEQFAAVTIQIAKDLHLISYRGTDDTIAGWREDFMMSFSETAGQMDAVKYFQATAKELGGKFMLSGHSKGGNLASFAASMVGPALQDQVDVVWCFDSPGFCPEVSAAQKFIIIAPKVRLFVPEFCIVGALMQHEVKPTIVKSDQIGAMQHDAFSWQVMGPQFVYAPKLMDGSKRLVELSQQLMDQWFLEQRKSLTDVLFKALAASGATTVSGLAQCGPDSYKKVMDSINQADPKDRDMIKKIARTLISANVKGAIEPLQKAIVSKISTSPKHQPVSIENMKAWRDTRYLRDLQNAIGHALTPKKRSEPLALSPHPTNTGDGNFWLKVNQHQASQQKANDQQASRPKDGKIETARSGKEHTKSDTDSQKATTDKSPNQLKPDENRQ